MSSKVIKLLQVSITQLPKNTRGLLTHWAKYPGDTGFPGLKIQTWPDQNRYLVGITPDRVMNAWSTLNAAAPELYEYIRQAISENASGIYFTPDD